MKNESGLKVNWLLECVFLSFLISKKLLNVNVMPESSTTMFSIHGVKLCSEGIKVESRRTYFDQSLF